MSRSAIRAATCMALAICVIGHAEAQTYPSRTVTLVVPFPAGGPTDTIGRVIAEGLQASLGQPVIIENAAGATGSIGTGRVARAEAEVIREVLTACNGNKSAAADRLGMSRGTLYKRLRHHRLGH